MRVHDGGHAVVVEVRRLASGQKLGHERPLVLGLVRQHGALDNVADGVNARHAGLEVVVHLDLFALHLHAYVRQPQVVVELPAPHTDEHDVGVDRLLAPPGRGLGAHLQALALPLHAGHLGFHLELDALLFEDRHELLCDLPVDAQAADAAEELDDRDLGAEPGPHRAELQPDDAAADDRQLGGHLVQGQRTGARDNGLLVELNAWQAHHVGSCGQHDVLGLDRLLAAVQEGN
mmetsp:Transcript_35881/g.108442  ORF Transcript_35881/g.108442 Transcript_35881/m.108442 type:complete len:233 (-) Transcript_35881:465-1163(-)